MKNYLPYAEYNPAFREISSLTSTADMVAQKQYILEHPFYFFKVIFHTLFDHPHTYLLSYIGCFGTYLDIPLPGSVCVVAYLLIILLALFEPNSFTFTKKQKIVLFSAAGLSFVLLLLSQHLTWDAVGVGVVDLLQGRYLAPILPLIFMMFSQRFFKIKFNGNLIVMSVIVFVNLFSIRIIYDRFIKASFYQKVEFSCDAETVDNGLFATSTGSVFMDGGSNQTSEEHRSGKFSALLSPQSPYGFTYKFKDLNEGDLIEVDAWEKGEGAQLIIDGKGKNCEHFYFPNNLIRYKDKDGWSRLNSVITMKAKCDSADVAFFIWNPTQNKVYVDDVKFSLKKYRKK